MFPQRVYYFHEGSAEDKKLLGNKGGHLCEMTRMKLSVPPGFVVTTEACVEYYQQHKQMSPELVAEYTKAVHELERQTGRKFPCDPMVKHGEGKAIHAASHGTMPLLLSVRSGAPVSMPGTCLINLTQLRAN